MRPKPYRSINLVICYRYWATKKITLRIAGFEGPLALKKLLNRHCVPGIYFLGND